jgi:hypothetical protein
MPPRITATPFPLPADIAGPQSIEASCDEHALLFAGLLQAR